MNANPLVTVIISAFKYSKFIKECIQSVKNQTYSTIQLVIIDDASKDKTTEKIKEPANIYNFQYKN